MGRRKEHLVFQASGTATFSRATAKVWVVTERAVVALANPALELAQGGYHLNLNTSVYYYISTLCYILVGSCIY